MKNRRIFSSNKLIYSYLKQTLEKTEWDNQEWTIQRHWVNKTQDEDKQNTRQHRNPKR